MLQFRKVYKLYRDPVIDGKFVFAPDRPDVNKIAQVCKEVLHFSESEASKKVESVLKGFILDELLWPHQPMGTSGFAGAADWLLHC